MEMRQLNIMIRKLRFNIETKFWYIETWSQDDTEAKVTYAISWFMHDLSVEK
jgi:hypothetical protein